MYGCTEDTGVGGFGGDGGGQEPRYPTFPVLVEFQNASISEPPTGSWVREVRLKSGLTRKELAEVVGVHEKTVQSWEDGKSTPRRDKHLTLAQLLSEKPVTESS